MFRPLGSRARGCVLAVFLTIAATALPARADEAPAIPDTVYTVPGIVVEAPRITVEEYNRSGFVAALDLGRRRHRVEDLSTVLSLMTGIRVRQYGGLGSFATVSIRGSSSSQVNLYLDGVPLNDAYTGVSNVGGLPLDGIRRVEVFRGFTPPNLGASAIGGSINLITRGDDTFATHQSRIEARQSFGPFETSRLSVSLWSGLRTTKLFVHGSRLSSLGNFTFKNDRATPFNPADDRVELRLNNDVEMWNVLGRVSGVLPVLGDASLSYNSVVREGGVPGVGSFQSLTARSERRSHLVDLRLEPERLLDERLRLFAGAFYSFANEQFYDPHGDITLTAQATDNDFLSYGGNVRGRMEAAFIPVVFEAFLESREETFRPRAVLPDRSSGPDRGRTTQTATLSGDLYLFRQALVLSLAGRVVSQATTADAAPTSPPLPATPQGSKRQTARTPQVGLRWHATSYLTLKANWGRSFRQPTMLELFGNVGSVTGAADLVPEAGINRDIGVVIQPGERGPITEASLELAYLDNDIDNLIVFFPNSQFTSRPTNIGRARIRGLEVSLTTLLWRRLRLAGNYVFLDSRDTGPVPFYSGNELPGRPRHDLSVFMEYTRRRWDAAYELHWMGANYLDPANLQSVPAREIHNLALRLNLFAGWAALTGEARNITDNQISDVNGFPMPGRSFYITLGVATSKGD